MTPPYISSVLVVFEGCRKGTKETAAMNGIATLEQARHLKALGLEQGHFPQHVYFTRIYPEQWVAGFWERDLARELCGIPQAPIAYIAAPPLLSGDLEHPGVVEWLSEIFDWRISLSESCIWMARPSRDANPVVDDTLPALIDKILAHMEAHRAPQTG